MLLPEPTAPDVELRVPEPDIPELSAADQEVPEVDVPASVPDEWLRGVAGESFAYLTTTGRVSGKPHEIEIWFAADGDSVYFLSGGRDRADWVRNVRQEPTVTVRIAGRTVVGTARIVSPSSAEDGRARDLVWRKHTASGNDLRSWRDTALPVAVDLDAGDAL